MKVNEKYIGQYQCEFGEEVLFTIVKRNDNELFAGTICNAGMIYEYGWKIDDAFSIDENLNDFIDYINDREQIKI